MLELKVFLYDSTKADYKGTEFSQYVLQGWTNTEDLTQELDTTELTLSNLDRKAEFPPSTKFILEVYEDGELAHFSNGNPMRFDRIVTQDTVQKVILTEELYSHKISLTEPSVIAQKRTVDNIATTYLLKDVTLETKSGLPIEELAPWNATRDFSMFSGNHIYMKTLVFSDNVKAVTKEGTTDLEYIQIDDLPDAKLKFILPKLEIYYKSSLNNSYFHIGDASYDYVIQEIDEGSSAKTVLSGSIISNSNLSLPLVPAPSTGYTPVSKPYDSEWLWEDYKAWYDISIIIGKTRERWGVRKYTDTKAPAPVYETAEFPVTAGKSYSISLSLHEFPDEIPEGIVGSRDYHKPSGVCSQVDIGYGLVLSVSYKTLAPTAYTVTQSRFIYSVPNTEETFLHGNPYSALLLLQKAIMNSNVYRKQNGVRVGDLNALDENGVYSYDCDFYIDEAYITELLETQVVESFYNQKNLWEIMVEVGYYIHAIPELVFGDNDKFKITFNKLGETDLTTGEATPMSIMNFRGIDDYITTTDSYISNFVQLGGSIEEYTKAKTTSEDKLVYNDTAEIIVSKKIIELLQLVAVCDTAITLELPDGSKKTVAVGDEADITDCVFEENVYNVLSINPLEIPNKGIAIYYSLRDNVIKGLNYSLPRSRADIYSQYTIKKVLYKGFTGEYPAISDNVPTDKYWSGILVNNFHFKVKYRTQDKARVLGARPDLRKYLLNSGFDKYPEYRQFNNQQDILIDSEKFGSNTYGSLIRTGNTNYTISEWVSSARELKTKGELAKINDELYYVAKITNSLFVDHIESTVEYSKDYNQLSKVIGIPSEPRFYEISEQSSTQREVSIPDYLLLTDNKDNLISDTRKSTPYLNTVTHLRDLLFYHSGGFLKYAVTAFKGDKDIGTYGKTYGDSSLLLDVLTPVNAYSAGNTLTYSWSMVDNFGAGDAVTESGYKGSTGSVDNAYNSLQAVRYTDKFGKATLFDFFLIEDLTANITHTSITPERIARLPQSFIKTGASITTVYTVRQADEPTNAQITTYVYGVLGRYPLLNESIICRWTNNNGVVSQRVYVCTVSAAASSEWQSYAYVGGVRTVVTNVLGADGTNQNERGLVLLKDCREVISFSYNLQLLTNSDTFVISPFVFSPKGDTAYMAFLSKEVNKLSNGYISASDIITVADTPLIPITVGTSGGSLVFGGDSSGSAVISVSPDKPKINNYTPFVNGEVKAVAIVYDWGGIEADGTWILNNKIKFILARNIPEGWTSTDILKDWYIGSPKQAGQTGTIFTKTNDKV